MNKPVNIEYVVQWRTGPDKQWVSFDSYPKERDGLKELLGCRRKGTAGEYRLVQRISVEVVVDE